MDKEDCINQESLPDACVPRRWTKSRVLLLGAILGMGIGLLNITAAANEWTLARCFDLPDFPVLLLAVAARDRFESIAGMGDGAEFFCSLVAIISYWTVLGLLLALVFCSARDGFIRKMVRNRTFRRILFYGAFGGVLVCGLHFLAINSGWGHDELTGFERPLNFMETPIDWIQDNVDTKFGFLSFGWNSLGYNVFPFLVLFPFYWAVIGLFLASVFGFVRVVRKRKDADVESATGPGGTVEGSKFP